MDRSLKTVLTLGVDIKAYSSVINKIQGSSFNVTILSNVLLRRAYIFGFRVGKDKGKKAKSEVRLKCLQTSKQKNKIRML